MIHQERATDIRSNVLGINLEWDSWIIFIQNSASSWISLIVSDAQCGKGINHISDLADSIVLDGQPCRRSVMSLPIHLIRLLHQWRVGDPYDVVNLVNVPSAILQRRACCDVSLCAPCVWSQLQDYRGRSRPLAAIIFLLRVEEPGQLAVVVFLAQHDGEPKLNLFGLSHRMPFVDLMEKLEGLLFLTVF